MKITRNFQLTCATSNCLAQLLTCPTSNWSAILCNASTKTAGPLTAPVAHSIMFWKIRRPRFATSWGGAQVAKLCLSYCLAGYGRGSPLVFTAWASGRDLGWCCSRTVPGPKSFFSWRSAVTLQAWAILLIPALINYSYSLGESIHCLACSQELRLSTYLWLAWPRGTYKIWLSCWQPYAVPFPPQRGGSAAPGHQPIVLFLRIWNTHLRDFTIRIICVELQWCWAVLSQLCCLDLCWGEVWECCRVMFSSII